MYHHVIGLFEQKKSQILDKWNLECNIRKKLKLFGLQFIRQFLN